MEPDLPSDDDGLPEMKEELPELKEERPVKRPRKRKHFDGPRMEELMKVEVVPPPHARPLVCRPGPGAAGWHDPR